MILQASQAVNTTAIILVMSVTFFIFILLYMRWLNVFGCCYIKIGPQLAAAVPPFAQILILFMVITDIG